MKRQQVYLLLGAALVLAIAGTIFQMVRSAGWKGQSANLEPFAQLPVNTIEKLVIKSSKGSITLQKVGEIWTVAERNGYPADFSKIRELIRSLWEFKVVRQLEVGPSQFARLHIQPPGQGDGSGVQLDLIAASDKPVKTLIFGKSVGGTGSTDEQGEGAEDSGRFVYDPSEKDKVYLGKESFYAVDPSPQNWIDKDFIKPETIKEVTRESSATGEGWKISRKDEKAQWDLAGAKPGEALDPQAVASLGNFSPNFSDVKPADAPDSETGLKQPVTVNLAGFDGFKYAVEIGGPGPEQTHFLRFKVSADLPSSRTAEPNESPDDKKKKDEDFSKQQDALKTRLAAEEKLQKWIFEVEDDSVETFLKPRQDILAKPAPTAAPNQVPNQVPNNAVMPRPRAPLPGLPSATPVPVAPSPTPAVSASPETTPKTEAVPSASPSPSATPETEAVPSASPSPSATPETEAVPSASPSPSATPETEAVPTASPSPSATPETETVPSVSPSPSTTPEA
jgi:hypothetical protein